MILGIALTNNFGTHAATWRMPHVDPNAYTNIDVTVEHVRTAERGGLQFIFIADRLFLYGNLAEANPLFNMDPIITLAAVTQATKKIGLIATVSTTFTEPYLMARQLKALDVISRGRVGWNAIPSYEPDAFANFGKIPPPRENKYERLHESIQVIQSLWGSWGYDAGKPDQSGTYANSVHIRTINMHGKYVGARGPLPIPPSDQGQPVIVMPASSHYGLHAAAMYADVIIGMPSSIEESLALRKTILNTVSEAGRDPKEIKFIVFVGFTIGETKQKALDTRRALDVHTDLKMQLTRLCAYLGLKQELTQLDEPLDPIQLKSLRPHPYDQRSIEAVRLAKEGWSPREILSHAIFDPYPTVVGTAEQVADHLQEWFEADAADGFMMNFDDFHTEISNFVDQVVPILRNRGLFHEDYEGTTLRDHLGLSPHYGLDPRIAKTAKWPDL
ncbi:NtaA/DmoA family FMN-dependent monooxygenase [Chryseobacterium sp. 09-1422]|uniref:NtaA/DmoA family FMN-dependent monooxygenase n=1 Tax=Chryseobacterium kimseyorum TaxID=2984028 RepID=A0ABT3I3T5_9FLAO|nr:NtaA/DmoA family FMN-dependent monooxygenase [Chryseobacterium kimseyorum]MCW3170731.1 NtaA/DmoA family FMN-dependent monooxygenase [Chryseobacterium kimseyorum]